MHKICRQSAINIHLITRGILKRTEHQLELSESSVYRFADLQIEQKYTLTPVVVLHKTEQVL